MHVEDARGDSVPRSRARPTRPGVRSGTNQSTLSGSACNAWDILPAAVTVNLSCLGIGKTAFRGGVRSCSTASTLSSEADFEAAPVLSRGCEANISPELPDEVPADRQAQPEPLAPVARVVAGL